MRDEELGALAVVGANIFFGSFGVPIKGCGAKMDPVVYQSYKSLMVFLTSLLVLAWEDVAFTWWGVLGALLWVANGVLAIIGIRLAGLGPSQAVWSSLTIVVSFGWGTLVFRDHVKSWPYTAGALGMMIGGMLGLSIVAAWSRQHQEQLKGEHVVTDEDGPLLGEGAEVVGEVEDGRPRRGRRQWALGMACAVLIGISNGSMMVPFEYAPPEAKGIQYVLSFGVGAAGITIVALAAYLLARSTLFGLGTPDLHLGPSALPACLTGVLWAAGNYCAIWSTSLLGYAVGFSAVQANMLVAGLWGVLWFREVRDPRAVCVFFVLFAAIIGGVVLLVVFG